MSGGRRLHLDLVGGAAGDMWLGMLLELGLADELLAGLPGRLGLERVQVGSERVLRGGLAARKVHVVIDGWEEGPGGLDRSATGDGDGKAPGDGSRHLADVRALLARADLPPTVRRRAASVFERLFEAEAAVHGSTAEEVHLHEAAAEDALIDVVGACLGLEELGISVVSCSTPLPAGSGRVRCSHGELPVPVPVVCRLLEGLPLVAGGAGEMITPTGAALLREVVEVFGPLPAMTLRRTGCGAGSREIEGRANVLRGLLGDDSDGPLERRVAVINTTIDDLLPQDLPPLTTELLEAGALDVWTAPVAMKKGRTGFLLTVISETGEARRLARRLLESSPTLGVRIREEQRLEWGRDRVVVDTPWGPVRIKRAISAGGRVLRGRPEFEDCLEAAQCGDVPVDEVRRAAHEAFDLRLRTEEDAAATGADTDDYPSAEEPE